MTSQVGTNFRRFQNCRDAQVPEKSGFPDFSSQLKFFPDFLFMV